MRAMILAAGFGTRLWPLTVDRTKPAVPFLNKPLITYSVEYLRGFNIDEMVVNLHHEGGSIRRALGAGEALGASIHYSEEAEILGTSGALDHAREWFTDDTFVVMNGKVITDIDLNAALKTHRERGALATLVLKENPKRERFSTVLLDPRGNIERFGEHPKPALSEDEAAPLMFTGIQIMEPEIFDYIPRNRFSHSTTDVYPRAIAEGRIIAAHISQGNWYELSTLERYLEISLEFLRREGRDIISGAGTTILPGAQVAESVLWERARIEPGAYLRRVIVGDDVTVPAGARIEGSVVVRKDRCSEIERGEVVGENLIVPI
jgi:NDP-sugar pyrophosphorylase family protein